MDKQRLTVKCRELYSISCDNHNGKGYEKEYLSMCMMGSLFCMAEINTIWKINYTLKEKKKKIEVACPEMVQVFQSP